MKTWVVHLEILRACAWPDLDPTSSFRSLPCLEQGIPCGRDRRWRPCHDNYKFDAIEAHTSKEAVEAAINLARLDGAGGTWFDRNLDIHKAKVEEVGPA